MDVLLVMNPQNSFLSKQGQIYMGERAETLKVRLVDFLSSFSRKKIFFREKHALEDDCRGQELYMVYSFSTKYCLPSHVLCSIR
ncbi:unnamed protein product [marine sediment metagenome]|uniref:Uncharacterized protein n=1 Tax=marine sediment metagenome TaxID=412755 RepID=X1DZI1_9ZZZZ